VLVRASQAAGRPLLSPTARRPVLAIIAACAAVLAVLGSLLAGYTGPSPADRPVDDRIFALLGTHPGIVTVTDIGTPLWGGIACLAIAAACAARRRYRAALLPLIAVPAGSILTDHVLKPLINRTASGSLMFPSGHTTVTCAMSVSVVIILAGPARPPLPAGARLAACAAALALVPVVAVGLIVGHYHFFTDTIGGTATGTAVALLTALALDALAGRLGPARRAPAEAAGAGQEAAKPEPAEPEPAEQAGISAPVAELP